MATYQPNTSTAYQGQGTAYQGQGTASWKSKLPALPREVNDLLLWRDWKKSGAVLGACTLLWFFLDSGLSPWTPLQLLAALVGFACPAFVAWSSAAPLLKRQPPPVPALLRDGLSQQQVDDFAERASRSANQALAIAGTLVSGRDIKLSAIVTAGAFIAFKVFGAISLITLTFIVVVLAFTVPKVYEMRKQDIDHVTHTVVTKAKEAHAEVEKVLFKKAPRASTKTE